MKPKTIESVSKMRGLIIRFLDIANHIEEEEWHEVIKSIQKERERLKRMKASGELGNIFVMLFFLNEILESIIDESP